MARENSRMSPTKASQNKPARSNPFTAILSGAKADLKPTGPTVPSKSPLRKNLPRSQTANVLSPEPIRSRTQQPLGEIGNDQSRPSHAQHESHAEPRPKSLHKRTKSALSLKGLAGRIWEDKDNRSDARTNDHPLKTLKQSKKSKSSTSLSAFLARPKSKGKDTVEQRVKDIENQFISDSTSEAPEAPIWAQFSSARPEHPAHESTSVALRQDSLDVEAEFEAVLASRNAPDDVKEKMRTLDAKLKAEFVRQHKTNSPSKGPASSHTAQPGSPSKRPRANTTSAQDDPSVEQEGSPKKSRPRSFQFTPSKGSQSPTKKQKSDKNHSRTKSVDLPRSSSSTSLASQSSKYSLASLVGASKQTSPDDFIVYLRKPQKLQDVEVGKLQRLRQLLRNETVEWVDTFITNSGMEEVVNLLYRIIDMEWREEHEDSLMHHTLSCLKALATTDKGLEHLSVLQEKLFPILIKLLYSAGEEKRGPAEFTTRDIMMSLIFTFLRNGPHFTPAQRAAKILAYLRDPQPSETERPPNFMLAMHRPRPYKVWFSEVSSITKEVFWIFLHAVNVIPYPDIPTINPHDSAAFFAAHFPPPRAPIPAAPHVGGVEWEATNYLASHLDVLNGVIACTPTVAARNSLRTELRDSGFEKAMGASLRTCKQKFYGPVHEALATYVGAGRADGWDVRMVREGPTREEREKSRSPNKAKAGDKAGKENRPPVLGELKLDNGPRLQLQVMNPDEGSWL